MNWDDLRIFLSVARARSLTSAATALRLDPATISRRVARLERDLGAVFFVRSPQGYELTASGEELRRTAEAMERAAEAAAETPGTADTLTGTLRIGAPDGCANFLLPPVVADIARANPGLEAQVLALPRVVNLSQREADMAVTVSRPTAGRLTVQKIADYRLSLAADRAYLAEAPKVAGIEDLKAHAVVGYIPDMIFDKELDYLSAVGIDRPRLASNSVAVQLNLLRAGGGIGFVHDFALKDAANLVRVLPDEVRLTRTFWLVRHADEARAPRQRRLADAVVGGLRRELLRTDHALDRAGGRAAG
ncbi:MAG: LysR family transcriptional regulator [Pseudomonadota bacterium]